MKRLLHMTNCLLLTIGTSAGSLVMRLYFLHGGHRVWLSSFLKTAGFPLAVSYLRHRNRQPKLISMKPSVLAASAFVGIFTGLDDYLYAYGVARLPVSTSALIFATQLGFTAFLQVKQ